MDQLRGIVSGWVGLLRLEWRCNDLGCVLQTQHCPLAVKIRQHRLLVDGKYINMWKSSVRVHHVCMYACMLCGHCRHENGTEEASQRTDRKKCHRKTRRCSIDTLTSICSCQPRLMYSPAMVVTLMRWLFVCSGGSCLRDRSLFVYS